MHELFVIIAAVNVHTLISPDDSRLKYSISYYLQGILHDWNDEDRVRILKNCRKALPEKNGMVIVADIVLRPDGDGLFDEARIGLDLMMMAQTGGKERSELEWKKIMEEGGFPRYNII